MTSLSGLSIRRRTADSATGWLYLRARYCGSTLNRFLSADSILPDFSDPQTLNLHVYVLNNPLRFRDPTGHCPAPPLGSGDIICVDLFIAAETVGGVGEGDDRTYDYDSEPDQSRAYAYLHLDDQGSLTLVEAFVNYSIVLGREFGPFNENNVFEVFQSPATNEIIVNWSLENGFSGYLGSIADDLADDVTPWEDVGALCLDFAATTLPDINGYLAIAQVDDRYEVIEMNRDPFPSLEIYHYSDGEFTQTILRRPEADFFGTFSAFYGLNPIARNDVITRD